MLSSIILVPKFVFPHPVIMNTNKRMRLEIIKGFLMISKLQINIIFT